ncbi:MAG: hypothetical protein GYA23_07295 [Methanomicrobiales archaeon]|nr:hypothetical protein [Methanomicrobiales archaeon]
MQDLSVDRIIALHDTIIRRDGGDRRVLTEANLHQVVFQANLFSEVIPRAAFCFYALIAYPAFRQGNCRTAKALAEDVLSDNGYSFDSTGSEALTSLARGILDFSVEPEEIEAWMAAHAEKSC